MNLTDYTYNTFPEHQQYDLKPHIGTIQYKTAYSLQWL